MRRDVRISTVLFLLLAMLFIAPAAFAGKATVRGAVKNPEGELLRATVEVVDASGKVINTAETGRKGTFRLTLDPGDITLRVGADGYAVLKNPMSLKEGDNLQVDIKLIDEASDRRRRAVDTYNAGAEAHRGGDLEAAARQYAEAASIDTTLAPAYLALAGVRVDLDDAAGAVQAIESYRELMPDDKEGKELALTAYRNAGVMDKAEALAAELGVPVGGAKAPGTDAFNEGATASQNGDYAAAAEAFRRAVESRPDWGRAHAALASSLYGTGELDEAVTAANRALELEPGDARALRVRYLVLDALGDEGRLQAWDAYFPKNEDDAVQVLFRRAKLDIDNEKQDRARAPLERILAVRPNHAPAHYLMGVVLAASDPTAARRHLETTLELAPDTPEAADAKALLDLL
ncbi:hypothetical protein ABI59_19890 [Acidobacteria bacterium Mor1]|nr:hypothetical protein ABI59_19890 [Acidobacteria bacterium Mor1]